MKLQEGFKAEEATVKLLENFRKMKDYPIYDLQCCHIPTFLLREREEEEGMTEKEIPHSFSRP